jgi:hypothetical protein
MRACHAQTSAVLKYTYCLCTTYIGNAAIGYTLSVHDTSCIPVGYICSGAIQSLACADVLHSFAISTVHHVLGDDGQTTAVALLISLHIAYLVASRPMAGQPPYIRHCHAYLTTQPHCKSHSYHSCNADHPWYTNQDRHRKDPGLALTTCVQHISQHRCHSASSCACCRLHQHAHHRPAPAQSLQRPVLEVGELAGGAVAVGDARAGQERLQFSTQLLRLVLHHNRQVLG